jgi:hypothetical protein
MQSKLTEITKPKMLLPDASRTGIVQGNDVLPINAGTLRPKNMLVPGLGREPACVMVHTHVIE